MGKKTKKKTNKRVSTKQSTKSEGDERCSGSDSVSLVAQAEGALSSMQLENALGYYEQALSIDASNCAVMDSLADLYLSLGESSRAYELLVRSIQVSPESNPAKYMYLAQLQQGEEALTSYYQALHFLTMDRERKEDADAVLVIDKQLIKSYCGIAELYLTDLCYDENAEQQCESVIGKALEIDPSSVDANHALANIRLSQSKPIEASELVEGVYRKIHDVRERINSRTVFEDLHAPEHIDFQEHVSEPDIPSLEICVSTVKLMLECATIRPNLADDALMFAAELLNDDDENVELWYIAGVAAMTTVPPDFSVAKQYFEQAMSMIDELKKLPGMQHGAMDEHYSLIVDHLAVIQSQQLGLRQLHDISEKKATLIDEKAEEWSDDDMADNVDGESMDTE